MASSIKTIVPGAIIFALGLFSTAQAGMPQASARMGLGAPAVAPQGFVQFCTRQPADCGASSAELAELRGQASGGQAVAAISYDWSKVFKTAKPAAPAPQATTFDWSKVFTQAPVPTVQKASAPYDWSAAFAQARAAPSAGVPASATVSAPVGPSAASDTPSRAGEIEVVTLTRRTWALVTHANDSINRALAERSDQEIYGVSEYWGLPLESGLKAGDCEDYALEKRRALIQAGVPARALSLAVVVTPQGQQHAVLLVATDRGEMVLDNLTPWVLPWTKTPYQWRERQVAGSASHWAMAAVGGVLPAPRLLLASLR